MPNMITTVLRNVLGGPVTRLSPRPPFKSARGHLDIAIDDCIFCGMCQRRCPADAIQVERAVKSWALNGFRCINCGECVSACPKKCLHLDDATRPNATARKAESFSQMPVQAAGPAGSTVKPDPFGRESAGGSLASHA